MAVTTVDDAKDRLIKPFNRPLAVHGALTESNLRDLLSSPAVPSARGECQTYVYIHTYLISISFIQNNFFDACRPTFSTTFPRDVEGLLKLFRFPRLLEQLINDYDVICILTYLLIGFVILIWTLTASISASADNHACS